MKPYKHQTKLIFVIIGILLGVGILIIIVISPLLSKIAALQNSIIENDVKLENIAAEIANYKILSTHLSQVAEQKLALARMFPAREDSVVLIEGLENALAKSAIEGYQLVITDNQEKKDLNQVSRDKAAVPIVTGITNLEEVPFTLQVTSNYRGLNNLFLNFEHMPLVMIPNKMTIQAEQVQDVVSDRLINTGRAATGIEGAFYIYKP